MRFSSKVWRVPWPNRLGNRPKINLAAGDTTVGPRPGQRRRVAGIDLQLPQLELLGGNALFVTLRERDLVEKPIGPGLVGDILGPVREQHVAHDPVAVPLLRPRELAQVRRCTSIA
jgi:hypothetical protein